MRLAEKLDWKGLNYVAQSLGVLQATQPKQDNLFLIPAE
jgi:hypothetical protein